MTDHVVAATKTVRGHWLRVFVERSPDDDHGRFYYYYRGVRVPWLLWVMFS